jgi:CRISPR/Cas system-associated exonuclease Cas4 (RecB family)
MTYSYTQISQYLSCPRRFRRRYLDGWQEKVEKELTGKEEEPSELIYFNVYESQIPVV